MKTWTSACLGLLLASTAWGVSIDDRCLQDGNSACVDWNQGLVIADGLGAVSYTHLTLPTSDLV